MFVGNSQKIYILDVRCFEAILHTFADYFQKTENNPVTVTAKDGTVHPAWGVEYDIASNKYRTMEVQSNTFCGMYSSSLQATQLRPQPEERSSVTVHGSSLVVTSVSHRQWRML